MILARMVRIAAAAAEPGSLTTRRSKNTYGLLMTPLEGTGGFVPGEYGIPYNTYVLESDRLTGPWRLVSYMRTFGEQAYWANIPSKFVSPDGRTAWLCYAANWTGNIPVDPPGSKYALCLHEIKLLGPKAASGGGSQ